MGYKSEQEYANSIYDSMYECGQRLAKEEKEKMQDKDGGYCPKCDTVWASPGKCRCVEFRYQGPWIEHPAKNIEIKNVPAEIANDIWNAAIEAAAETITRLNREGPYQAITGATEIRKLKK